MKIANMKLAHQFMTLLIIVVAGFCIYGEWSFRTLDSLKVNGPTYQKIVQDKDLLADILPPPEYVIESYLVSLQAMRAAPADRKSLIESLKTLKHDYETRRAFWLKEGLDDTIKNQLDKAGKPAEDFFQIAFGQFVPALEKNDLAAANSALDLMGKRYAIHRVEINKLVELATKHSEINEANAKTEIKKSTLFMSVILILVTGLAGLFLLLVARGLIRQLGGEPVFAVALAARIADGDLTEHEDGKIFAADSLLAKLTRMREKLTDIVGEVQHGSQAVSTAAAQLAKGNDELSQRTQEQASSLEETAASMEQMTSTVKQNAGNASHANQLASGARTQAERGAAVAAQAVAAMSQINISSRKIADIVALIDEIAFQTNLLSLNAAVEAARAGEQGRGFAVVASEVRNLAQRSAAAAKEIKALINESVDRVQAGSALVNESGAALTDIVESVKKVTDIVAEIAAASQEQSSGIDQVNQAVTQMDEVTQQNAALVEEAAAAAHAMQEQAIELQQQMAFFRVATTDAGVSSLPPGRTLQIAPAPRLVAKPGAQHDEVPVARSSSGGWGEF